MQPCKRAWRRRLPRLPRQPAWSGLPICCYFIGLGSAAWPRARVQLAELQESHLSSILTLHAASFHFLKRFTSVLWSLQRSSHGSCYRASATTKARHQNFQRVRVTFMCMRKVQSVRQTPPAGRCGPIEDPLSGGVPRGGRAGGAATRAGRRRRGPKPFFWRANPIRPAARGRAAGRAAIAAGCARARAHAGGFGRGARAQRARSGCGRL